MQRKFSIVIRTLLVCMALILLTGITLFASSLFTGEIKLRNYPQEIPPAPLQMRAFTVYTGIDGDFPGMPGLSAKEQQMQLQEIVDFADTYGFNTIFFEAVPEGDTFYRSSVLPSSAYWMGKQGAFTFFDPLRYLTDIAKEHEIQVFALVDPFSVSSVDLAENAPAAKNPEWLSSDGFLNPSEPQVQKLLGKISQELTENYDIAGVVLHEVSGSRFDMVQNYKSSLSELLSQMHGHLRSGQRLGIVTNAADTETAKTALAQNHLDFVVPEGFSDPLEDPEQLVLQLTDWQTLTKGENAAFYPLHTLTDETAFAHTVDNSGYYERQHGSGGVVVSRYGSLHTKTPLAAVSLAASFRQDPAALTLPDLTFSQEFAITRPSEETRLSSDWTSYYIGGTSVPGQLVTLNGEELETSPRGLWGALVELEYGKNTFEVVQNGVSKTAVIYRAESSIGSISDILKSSVYPPSPEMVLEGDTLSLSCTAPAGGNITASVGGLSVALEAPSAQKGTAVTYQGKLDVSSLATAGQVKGVGTVSYQLQYDGFKSFQESAGTVYIAGTGAVPVAKMNSFGSMVNQNAANDGIYLSILRKDCVDVITENAGIYYKLSMGGYILKSAVDIPEGATSATAKVSKIAIQQTAKGEKLVITNDLRPAYVGQLKDNTLTFTIFNTTGWETMNPLALKGELFDSISADISEDTNSVTLTVTLKDGAALTGWDVSFEGDEMALYLRRRPVVDLSSALPLSNVTVVLDPGHGGNDPGALGIPGTAGPTENILNLANSYAIRSRLEAMGAQVHLVHENTDVSLNARLEFAQKMDADVFISSHHNSVALSSDGSTASGVEVYYWNDQSASFAQQIGDLLSVQGGRKMRSAEQSFYRVTMMTACPSVLVESGFICNPQEYDKIADPFAMLRYGNAVSDAVLTCFLPQSAE